MSEFRNAPKRDLGNGNSFDFGNLFAWAPIAARIRYHELVADRAVILKEAEALQARVARLRRLIAMVEEHIALQLFEERRVAS